MTGRTLTARPRQTPTGEEGDCAPAAVVEEAAPPPAKGANLQDQFNTDYWHWTSTQFSEYGAWDQYFYDGSQYYTRKVYERRCRFVRKFKLAIIRPASSGISRLPPTQAKQLKLPGF